MDNNILLLVAAGVVAYTFFMKRKTPPTGGGPQPPSPQPPTQQPTQPPTQQPAPPPSLPPGKGQEPIGWTGPGKPFCAVNLAWRTPQLVDFGGDCGKTPVGCTDTQGPNCTGLVQYDETISNMFITKDQCINFGTGGGDPNDPGGSNLAAELEKIYQTQMQAGFSESYAGIQAAPLFWYDPMAQRGTYMHTDCNATPDREMTVDLSSWAVGTF